MKTTSKDYSIKAWKYMQKFKQSWEYGCIAGDAYLAGYRQAREDAIKELKEWGYMLNHSIMIRELELLGEKEIEVESTYRENGTGSKSFMNDQEKQAFSLFINKFFSRFEDLKHE